jgi:hypothetical protein
VTVARHRAANLGEDVLIAVVVQIGERDPMAFVEFAGAG